MKLDIVPFIKISYRQMLEGWGSRCAGIDDERNLKFQHEIQYFIYQSHSSCAEDQKT